MILIRVARYLLIVFVLLAASTCKENEVRTRVYPVVDTNPVTEINTSGATLNAKVLSIGASGVSDHGFVYSNSPDPTIDLADRISLGEQTQSDSYSTLVNRNLVKDNRYYVKAYAISKGKNFVVYGQQVQFVSLGGTPQEVTDFTPKTGVVADTISITGKGFSNVLKNNVVLFGTASTSPVKATDTQLWCLVPAGTAVGDNDLSVLIGQFTVKAKSKFSLKVASITSFSPASVSFGDTVTINGLNFPKQKSLITSTILGKDATVLNISTSQLKAIVKLDVSIPQSLVTVTVGVQNLSSATNITLLKPVLQSFTPIKGTKDTEVTLNGNYFSPVLANDKVTLNGKDLVITQAVKTSIKAKLPTGITPGSYPIVITVASQITTSSSTFEVVKPVITTINPLLGTWGNTVTITGDNFGTGINDNIVKFGTVQALVVSASATEIKAQVPNNILTMNSTIMVQATTIDNQTVTFGTPFVLAPPVISNFTPGSGKSKSLITINGQNFNPVPANQVIKFGDRIAQVTIASSNQLTVSLPPSLAESDVQIRIDVAEQFALSSQLFHLISPWRAVADLPGALRADATAFSIGTLGYVGLGDEIGLTIPERFIKKFWNYDPTSNAWTEVATFSFPNSGTTNPFVNMISMTNGTNSFVGLGAQGVGQFPEGQIRKYDPGSNSWLDATGIGNNPSVYAVEAPVAYSINGQGYVTTGRDIHNNSSFMMWQYDPGLDSWTRKADLPNAPRWEATGFAIGSKAYLTGGAPCYNCVTYLDDNWEYDVTANTWKKLKNFPGTPRYRSTGFSINGTGYLLGGEIYSNPSGNTRVGDFWMYDPGSDGWTQLEDFPGEKRSGAVVFVVNNKAYFGTGVGVANYLKDFWEFDPSKL